MADLTVKQFDTGPPWQATLSDTNGAIDLTAATEVLLFMKGAATSTEVTGACTITGAADGDIEYVLGDMDTSIADTYTGEFAIHWSDGTVQKVPNASAENWTIAVDPDVTGSAE
jgi:hypothetical protein